MVVVAALTASLRVAFLSATLHIASDCVAAALATVATVTALLYAWRSNRPFASMIAAAAATTTVGIWAFEVAPVVLGNPSLEQRLAWGHITTTTVAAALFLLAAALPGRAPWDAGTRLIAIGAPVATVVASVAVVALLPAHVRLESPGNDVIVHATGGLLPAQAVVAGLFGAAAVLFFTRGSPGGGALRNWLGWTLVLFACSRLVFFYVPSLYVEWVSPGDLFRVAAYGLLATAIVVQMRLEWTNEAVQQERRRVAQKIHGGLAQDLAHLLLMIGEPRDEREKRELDAARRAFSASRAVLDDLSPD